MSQTRRILSLVCLLVTASLSVAAEKIPVCPPGSKATPATLHGGAWHCMKVKEKAPKELNCPHGRNTGWFRNWPGMACSPDPATKIIDYDDAGNPILAGSK